MGKQIDPGDLSMLLPRISKERVKLRPKASPEPSTQESPPEGLILRLCIIQGAHARQVNALKAINTAQPTAHAHLVSIAAGCQSIAQVVPFLAHKHVLVLTARQENPIP